MSSWSDTVSATGSRLLPTLLDQGLISVVEPELVRRAAAGDQEAFAELYLRYAKRIASLVGRMLRYGSECEEVTQEVFLQIHLGLPSFEGRSSFYTWIFRVAKNVAMCHIRQSRHRYQAVPLSASIEAGLVPPSGLAGSNPERDAEFNELLAETSRVIDLLTPNLRDVMILGPTQGRTCEEVSKHLGVTREVVKSRLHRARTAVEEAMWRVDRRGIPLIGTSPAAPGVSPSLVVR